MFNRFLSRFQTGNNDEDELSLLSDNHAENTLIDDIDKLSPNQTIPITPENDGSFAEVPREITKHIISFLDIRSMAKFAQTNRHLHDVTENTIVMLDKNNELTGEKKLVPAMMIASCNTGTKRAATYAEVRMRLFDEAPKHERIKHVKQMKKSTEQHNLRRRLMVLISASLMLLAIASGDNGERLGFDEEVNKTVVLGIWISLIFFSSCTAYYSYSNKNNINLINSFKEWHQLTVEKKQLKGELTPEISDLLHNTLRK